ncbi:prenyltransferase/squalene oxidase repeat-containing protein [Pedococcus bigeumensis]|uniref:prenyltransferase/squalene oxidase repeat-containing protein n=1 Tax=Pedococcus bigeumensis TaxID=433644 RepID=UPI002FE7AC98
MRPFGTGSSLRAALVPDDSSDQAAHAAGFIVRTLATRQDHYNYPASDYFDGGNTVDAVLALDGAGAGLDQADATTDYLAAHVDDYVGYPDPAGSPTAETYAGPLGKLVLGVVAQGGDPTDFGGQDLVARLEGLMTVDGRFSDKSNFGDYSNTIGQVLDLIALGRATGSVPDAAGDYLLDQQCGDGGFRGNLDVAGAPCSSDADATAFAAQALVGLLGADDPATADALAWLSSHQAPNGGFRNDDGQYNANTAGVAAQAFAAGGLDVELASAQDFLAGLQLDCSFATGLRGGIAFTAADYATLKTAPKTTAAIDRALRATPQATLGLAGGSLLTVTADGASAIAPALDCPASTTTTMSPASSTSTSATPGTGADDPADPASATPGALAFTGSNVAALTLLGALLLLAGATAIVLARRKGVHV